MVQGLVLSENHLPEILRFNSIHSGDGAASIIMLIALLLICISFNANSQNTVLVIHPNGNNFNDASGGIAGDLTGEMVVKEKIISVNSTPNDIAKSINDVKPDIAVLMDNSAIRLFNKFQQAAADSSAKIPVIALMSILVDIAIDGMDNAAGIRYEIPIVTSARILRSLSKNPLSKIGIIHRDVMKKLIDENRENCSREKIIIISRCIQPNNQNWKPEVEKALNDLLKDEKVDALWIPNDNLLLSPLILKDVWIPLVNKYKKPVIVGVEMLANPEFSFGTLSVTPDHVALGIQTAALIRTIEENGWTVPPDNIEPPLSVSKVLNIRQAGFFFPIRQESISNIDKVLK